jgi:hypothetical protein
MTPNVFGRFDPLGYFIRLNGYCRAEIDELLLLLDQGKTSADVGRSYAPLGTLLHESVHCFQIASTPFGQFWTRALLSQALFVSLTFRQAFKSRPGISISLPLDNSWLAAVGDDLAGVPANVRRTWREVDELLETMVGSTNVTIEEACRIHGDAFRFVYEFGYVDRTQDKATSSLPELTSAVGNLNANPMWDMYPITSGNLLETQARLIESGFLHEQKDSAGFSRLAAQTDASRDGIVLKLLAGYHDEFFEYRPEFVETAVALIDLALFAPIDLALRPLWSRALLWEDIHPAYRFVRAANITREIGFLPSQAHFKSYQETICRHAGWYTPNEVIDALLPRLASPKSPYDRFFGACLKLRMEHPSVFALGLPLEHGLIPPLVSYDDELVVNPAARIGEDLLRLIEGHSVREIARQLLFEQSIEPPEVLRQTDFDLQKLILANFHVHISEREP